MVLKKKIDELIEAISHLALEVAKLRSDVNTLMFREAVKAPAEEPELLRDEAEEMRNRKFAEGLDAILGYDGRANRGGNDDAE